MEKPILVKGHYRNGKYIKAYRYIRQCKEPTFRGGKIGKSYMDDTRRKIMTLRNYSDFQSSEYQVMMDYLEKECPQVAYLIGDNRPRKHLKITKEVYEKVNYAYDILYSK